MASRLASPALASHLRRAVSGEVRFDDGSRALYSTDASNYRQVPVGVVLPRSREDVIAAVEVCRAHGAAVLSRGGGTSLAGQTCNEAVVLDFSKYMNRILELDPERRIARVEPGVVLDDLRDAAERHHLTFAPDPSTHNRCTLGGMIGNNSCGVHSLMGGKTDVNVEELEVLTYDGQHLRVGATADEDLEKIVREGGRRGDLYGGLRALRDQYAPLIRERFPDIPRCVSGYNLPYLLPEKGFDLARALVGSEGTCVTVLEATVRLVPSPKKRVLLVLGYPDVYLAGDAVPEVLRYGPIGLEGFDGTLVDDMRKKNLLYQEVTLLPEGRGWLMAEFGGETMEEAEERAKRLTTDLEKRAAPPSMRLFHHPRDQLKIWEVRESGLAATAVVPGEPPTWPGWEDAAVRPDRLGDYLRDFRRLTRKYGYQAALYGHFGEACIHTRQDFDFSTEQGRQRFRAFMEEAADLVVRHGGSLSGEHGDGQARSELLPKMFGPELVEAFGRFKAIWDPQNRMNPGKLGNTSPLDGNLRLGEGYRPRPVRTHFAFPDDDGSLAKATLRCVGVGKCRRHDAGLMCPSYMVTGEEMHSTRGRARLLFEMLQGNPIEEGWRSESVKEALDLCLACKGCKGECPVNVDMATYKAEFLSHYYEGRLRPMSGYTMGLIMWWARLASLAPDLVNLAGGMPVVSPLLKRAAGIAPERQLPSFAPQTFRSWFERREPRNHTGSPVILWPDTFTNHLQPEVGRAAVEVLEAAGYRVSLPRRPLCCGRPLYDYGWLDQARGLLRQTLAALAPVIEAGVPLVGLEPSCLTVFRDELTNLLPHDARAARLRAQSFLLSELLERDGRSIPTLERRALVQPHCHHRAVLKLGAEQALMERMGLDYQVLDSGCCGMAGAFGFERDHYQVSMRCGERVLLPAVRAAPKGTLIIADGFSCREQIAQSTDRRALHLAQVLQMALREDCEERPYPEQRYLGRPASIEPGRLVAMATGGVIGGWLAARWRSGRL